MAIDEYDPSLNTQCISCEDVCNNDGCSKFLAVGPCSTIINAVNPRTGGATLRGYVQPEDMIFDMDVWCRVTALTSLSYNPNATVRKRGYIGECFETTKPGRERPTIDVGIDFCKFDKGHGLLNQNQCLIGWLCMDNRADFLPNTSPKEMKCIRYGVARVEAAQEDAVFDEEDVRNYTLHIHRYKWEFNMQNGVAVPATALNYSTEGEVEAA